MKGHFCSALTSRSHCALARVSECQSIKQKLFNARRNCITVRSARWRSNGREFHRQKTGTLLRTRHCEQISSSDWTSNPFVKLQPW